jgi:TatD family-associated radical SAM protein
VNPTNRCNYNCEFCLRKNGNDGSIYTHNLWLEREPTREEMLESIESHDLSQFKQLAFVGFGEPSYRIEDICWVVDRMKEHGTKIYTRMDTNGTGCLIHGRDICPEFAGRFDMVSISLNTDTSEKYDALCHPVQNGCYEAMKTFAKEIQKYVPKVMMTVVDTIPAEEIEACRKICEEEIGAIYRVREYIED